MPVRCAGGIASGKVFLFVFFISIFHLTISGSRIEEKGDETKEQEQNLEDEKLFHKYGWTIADKISSLELILPSTFIHEAGEYPIKLYWAYNNELSKSIGLDFAPHLGKKVMVEIYALSEPLPAFMEPRDKAFGVTLRSGPKPIGAYIHAGRHSSFACSLDRKRLPEITKKSWGEWIDDYIDYANDIEMRLSTMRPDEIIEEYFKALNRQDWTFARACKTRRNLMDYLSANMDNMCLYNKDYSDNDVPDKSIWSYRLITIDEWEHLRKGNPPGTLEYEVKFRLTAMGLDKTVRSDSIEYLFFLLKKETERGGWRIDAIGTGP